MSTASILRRWLGLDVHHHQPTDIKSDLGRLSVYINHLRIEIEIHNAALARIIAKLDPLYGQSENPADNPDRKAKSDTLSDSIIAKLRAEQAVCQYYGYTPTKD